MKTFTEAVVDYDVDYDYPGQPRGTLMVTDWQGDELVRREPANLQERVEALEKLVLEMHAKFKRMPD